MEKTKEMKKQIKAVMLPTEDRTSKIWFDNDTKKLLYDPIGVMNCNPLYLYITVSQDVEPIKDGDWIIVTNASNGQNFLKKEGDILPKALSSPRRKIIATTDPKLKNTISIGIDGTSMFKTIPQLQQSFLKEYVANPDGEFEVEYEVYSTSNSGNTGRIIDEGFHGDLIKLKLNQDNTVNITSIEEWKPKNGEQVWIKVFSNWSSGSYIGLDLDGKKHLVRSPKEAGGQLMISDKILPITATPNKNITSIEGKMYSRREVLLLLHDLSRHLSPNNTTIDLTDWIKKNL
jgi:hypothetical protein